LLFVLRANPLIINGCCAVAGFLDQCINLLRFLLFGGKAVISDKQPVAGGTPATTGEDACSTPPIALQLPGFGRPKMRLPSAFDKEC
jgi:hypothetical protein